MAPDYKKLYQKVCELYRKSKHFYYGEWDETFFTLRVFELCKKLIRKTLLEVDKEVVLTAAIFHDIGKTRLETIPQIEEKWDKHPKYGEKITRQILQKEKNLSTQFIDRVCCLIKHHENRPKKVEMMRSNELKILQDAILLAELGIGKFIRPFLYSGKHKQQIIHSINNGNYFNKNNNNIKETILKLNLHVSRRIARKMIRETDRLNKKLEEITRSELLK
ncbi:MAG: HD domain-containing protein [Asgard group archaeon]|nr:HD domain-containing protein [Asgard group archaeon]